MLTIDACCCLKDIETVALLKKIGWSLSSKLPPEYFNYNLAPIETIANAKANDEVEPIFMKNKSILFYGIDEFVNYIENNFEIKLDTEINDSERKEIIEENGVIEEKKKETKTIIRIKNRMLYEILTSYSTQSEVWEKFCLTLDQELTGTENNEISVEYILSEGIKDIDVDYESLKQMFNIPDPCLENDKFDWIVDGHLIAKNIKKADLMNYVEKLPKLKQKLTEVRRKLSDRLDMIDVDANSESECVFNAYIIMKKLNNLL